MEREEQVGNESRSGEQAHLGCACVKLQNGDEGQRDQGDLVADERQTVSPSQKRRKSRSRRTSGTRIEPLRRAGIAVAAPESSLLTPERR
jgi:hypothetical protein